MTSSCPIASLTVHGCPKPTGDHPDYAVLYGDELARAGEGNGAEDHVVAECEVVNDENTRILVSYTQSGLTGVSAYSADEPDDETTLTDGLRTYVGGAVQSSV
ncbi:hypothetical protein [Natrinema thermotolerans]